MNTILKTTMAVGITILISSCKKDESTVETVIQPITTDERSGLLYMLEEEKLARDVYIYLDNLWNAQQFTNIQNSEDNHMNAIASILDQQGVTYTILPEGQFTNPILQDLYNDLTAAGSVDLLSALEVGATIEDLDIVDLEEYIHNTTNSTIISTYESLKCGSRNHLRSYVGAIETNGGTYTPQFLTEEEYNEILAGTHETCN